VDTEFGGEQKRGFAEIEVAHLTECYVIVLADARPVTLLACFLLRLCSSPALLEKFIFVQKVK
jgi:hypothetical protein